jgi:hypothetical protein
MKTQADNYTKNSIQMGFWTIAWVATSALAALGPRLIWEFATLPTILGVLINLGIGFRMIWASKRFLQGLDELGQKIYLDAAVLTLGVGMVCACSYELLEDIKLISYEPEIPHMIILMSLVFMGGMVAGHRKYR